MPALEIASDKQAQNWRFWPTIETIQNDIPSVTAIAETLIVIPLYWWIALQIGILPSLLLSATVAPLVLLRSEESVELGVSWFLAFEKQFNAFTSYEDLSSVQRYLLWSVSLISIIVSSIVAFSFLSISDYLIDLSLWFAGVKILILVALIWLFAAFILHVALVLMLPLVRLPLLALKVGNKRDDSPFRQIFRSIVEILVFLGGTPGIFVGLLAATTLIRIAATLSYICSGIYALPKNFRRLTICTSPAQVPEIVPGIEGTESQFRFGEHFKGVSFKESYVVSTIYIAGGFLSFFPPGFTVSP
jgi:hypothetical protein